MQSFFHKASSRVPLPLLFSLLLLGQANCPLPFSFLSRNHLSITSSLSQLLLQISRQSGCSFPCHFSVLSLFEIFGFDHFVSCVLLLLLSAVGGFALSRCSRLRFERALGHFGAVAVDIWPDWSHKAEGESSTRALVNIGFDEPRIHEASARGQGKRRMPESYCSSNSKDIIQDSSSSSRFGDDRQCACLVLCFDRQDS